MGKCSLRAPGGLLPQHQKLGRPWLACPSWPDWKSEATPATDPVTEATETIAAAAAESVAGAVYDNLVIAGFPHITAFDFAFGGLLALPYLNQGAVRRNPNIYFIATLAIGGSAFGHKFQNRNPEYLDRPADYFFGIIACLASVAVFVHHVRENLSL